MPAHGTYVAWTVTCATSHVPRYCTGTMDAGADTDANTMHVKRPDINGVNELKKSPTALTPSTQQPYKRRDWGKGGHAKRVHLRTPEVQLVHWNICGGWWFRS